MELQDVSPDAFITQYFTEAKSLTELFTSNLTFTSHITGLGFDNVPVCYSLGSSVDDSGSLLESFASSPQPCGKQSIVFIHNKSIVLEDEATEYKEKYPVLFYAAAGLDPGSVKLWMSSRTHSLLQKNNYGLPLAEATKILPDSQNSPKFHLSAKWLETEIKKTLPKNLLMVNPLEDIENCFGDMRTSFRHSRDIGEVNEHLRSIYSVKIVPGFASSEWPASARDWLCRPRKWPARAVVMEASEEQVRIVPHSTGKTTDKVHSGAVPAVDPESGEEDPGSDCWTYDFSATEDFLLHQAGAPETHVLLISQVLLYQISDPNMQWHDVLKPAFLWYMEKKGETKPKDFFDNAKEYLAMLRKYLENKMLPHYFIPKVNVLNSIAKEDVEEMLESVTMVTEMTDEELHNLWTGYLQASDELTSTRRLCVHLRQRFDWLVKLLHLQMYHRLHATEGVDASIKLHRELLQYLQHHSIFEREYWSPLEDIVRCSLGCVLTMKAAHVKLHKEKLVLAGEGDLYLKQALNMDVLSARVKLAGIHFFKKEYEEVLKLIEPVKELLKSSSEFKSHDTSNPEMALKDFRDFLLEEWRSRTYMFDILYSHFDKPFAPGEASTSSGLMEGQVLGYVPFPVATANGTFLASYLYIMSLIQLNREFEVKPLGWLDRMETMAGVEQDDMNEKRSVVYLNMLAQIYFKLNDKETGTGMLRKSMTILSNPRNPARWKLFSMGMERTRKYLTWGVAFFVASTVTACVLHCAKPNMKMG